MACVDDRGTLTPIAAAILRALGAEGATPAAVARASGLPLYRVRAGLRELADAGFAREGEGGAFTASESGVARLAATP